jgi:meiotic recombination protein SPO11
MSSVLPWLGLLKSKSITPIKRSAAKGLFCGSALRLVLQDGTKIYGNNYEVINRMQLYSGVSPGYQATLIPVAEDIASIELEEDIAWILVVEKEVNPDSIVIPCLKEPIVLQAVFQTLCRDGLANHDNLPGPGIILTVRPSSRFPGIKPAEGERISRHFNKRTCP